MTPTLTWTEARLLPRIPAADLRNEDIPKAPGIFIWFRNDEPIYVGKATGPRGLLQQLGDSAAPDFGPPDSTAVTGFAKFRRSLRSQIDDLRKSVVNEKQIAKEAAFRAASSVAWQVFEDRDDVRSKWKILMAEWTPTRPAK